MRGYRAHRRVYAVFFTAIFALVGWADASGLHICPQHDGLPYAESAAAPMSADLGHTSHAQHAQADAEAPSHGDHEGPCTCVGSFDVDESSLQSILPAVAFTEPPSLTNSAEARAQSVVLIPPQYELPYANAPPHLI